jgi:O-antigen ligase
VFLSLVWSNSFSLSFRFIFFAITCMLCVVVFVNAFDTENKLFVFICFLAAGLFVSSAYALFQRLTGVESNGILTDLTLNANMPGRVYSFFENPNSYANLLVYFTPLMLCMFLFAPKRWQRLGFGAVFVLCALALVMTYSRGGWLAFAFSMFILMCLLCPRWIPLVMAVGVLCLPILPSSILNRLLTIFNMSDSSTYTRTYIYAAMLRLIKMNPIFGVGLGADTIKQSIAVAQTYTAKAVFIHGHNIYFQIGAESGIIGIIAFIMAVFCGMRAGGRRLRRKPTTSLQRGIIAGCISGLSGSLLFGLTDYPWSYPRVMVLFWLLFAIMCAATGISKNKKAGKTNG